MSTSEELSSGDESTAYEADVSADGCVRDRSEFMFKRNGLGNSFFTIKFP